MLRTPSPPDRRAPGTKSRLWKKPRARGTWVYAVFRSERGTASSPRGQNSRKLPPLLQMTARIGIENRTGRRDASGQIDLGRARACESVRATKPKSDKQRAGRGGLVNPAAVGRNRPRATASLSARMPAVGRPARGRCGADRLPHVLGYGPPSFARTPRIRACLYVRRDTTGKLERRSSIIPAASWDRRRHIVVSDADARRAKLGSDYIAGQIGLGRRCRVRAAPGTGRDRSAASRGIAMLLRRELANDPA